MKVFIVLFSATSNELECMGGAGRIPALSVRLRYFPEEVQKSSSAFNSYPWALADSGNVSTMSSDVETIPTPSNGEVGWTW